MQVNLEELLSPRVSKHCLSLYQNGHFKDAAREAMIQVEQALREKGRLDSKLFGRNLVVALFKADGKNQNIKLRVPLGNDLQESAQILFEGAFSYYRNYAAHNGSKIDAQISLRILIIASELLDLVDASYLSFADVGGVKGIVKAAKFKDETKLAELLKILDGWCLPKEGFYDVLFDYGFDNLQIDAVFDLNLVEYEETKFNPTIEEIAIGIDSEIISCSRLTDLGRQVIEQIHKSKDLNDENTQITV